VKQSSIHFCFAMINCVTISWPQVFKQLFPKDVTLRRCVGMKGSRNASGHSSRGMLNSAVGWKKQGCY